MPKVKRRNIGRRTRHANQQRIYSDNQTESSQSTSAPFIQLQQNGVEVMRIDQPNNSEDVREQNSMDNQANRQSSSAIVFDRLAFRYDPMQNYAADKSVNIGTMTIVCSSCNALKFPKETSGLCCASGKVKLPELNPPPEPLHSLVSGTDNRSRNFLLNIRKYNSCFQMTSFGATNIIKDGFMPTFKVIDKLIVIFF